MKPLLVTSGEPAGVGPDVCLDLFKVGVPLVVMADKHMLEMRAKQLGRVIDLQDYVPGEPVIMRDNLLTIYPLSCPSDVVPGVLNPKNVPYVMNMLDRAADLCLQKEFSAIVTAPVHKEIINEAGVSFTGHTEFFQAKYGVDTVVMMLACDVMRVALMTTHIALRQVPDTVTRTLMMNVITCLNHALQRDFSIPSPRIWVAGLNPHAGEGGYMGMEEIEVLTPALNALRALGIDVHGPFSADTLFTLKNLQSCDVFVAMYHDQGLSVLKFADFGHSVNVTLGLPVIRTSVDHGTALTLAGTGRAEASSLLSAVTMAAQMVHQRAMHHAD